MKLTKVVSVVSKAKGTSFGQNEKSADRIKRLKAFWSDKVNAVIHPVGQLLAFMEAGKSLAQYVFDGESIEMTEVSINGQSFPLQDGFRISLDNVVSGWSCPACRSAHGSGVYPSREVTVKGLAKNSWYYNPATRALFVISDSCWTEYVVGLSAVKAFKAPSAKVPVTAPVKAADSK